MTVSDVLKDEFSPEYLLGFASNFFTAFFDVEKFLFLLFFTHYKDLKRERLRLSWLMQVTLPFYASVGLIHWVMKACIPKLDDLEDYYEN